MENKRRYRHPYDDDTKAFKSCAGNQFEVEERLVIDDDGLWSLDQVGVVDQQARIDAERESTDLKTMIERYKNSGDISHLNRVSGGAFVDLTGAPTSLAEYYQVIADAEAEFMSQPLSVREQFGHNPVAYFNDVVAKARAVSDKASDVVEKARAAVAQTATTVEPKGDVVSE